MFDRPPWNLRRDLAKPWLAWTDHEREDFLTWMRSPDGDAAWRACADVYAADLRTGIYRGPTARESWTAFLRLFAIRSNAAKVMAEFPDRWPSPVTHLLARWLVSWYAEPFNLNYLLRHALLNLPVRHKGEASDPVQEILGLRFGALLDAHDPAKGPFHKLLLASLRYTCWGWENRRENNPRERLTASGSPGELDDDGPATPEVGAAEKQFVSREYLPKLKPADQALLHLRYWEERSETEIADVLGIARGTAAQRLRRARRRLAVLMLEDASIDATQPAVRLCLDENPELTPSEEVEVRAQISRLKSNLAQILELRFLNKMSLGDIAKKLTTKELPNNESDCKPLLSLAKEALLAEVVRQSAPPLLCALIWEGE